MGEVQRTECGHGQGAEINHLEREAGDKIYMMCKFLISSTKTFGLCHLDQEVLFFQLNTLVCDLLLRSMSLTCMSNASLV